MYIFIHLKCSNLKIYPDNFTVFVENYYFQSFDLIKKSITFATQLVLEGVSTVKINRETGVNPVQSRCCKLFQRFEQHFCHWYLS
jgi:hypothetical protein